ncbi:hypothetical protein AAVH_17986 [Aphelenchoides avenae]|nr:hypothetical protein AAVH_17986 [Aphelenchus avenae]
MSCKLSANSYVDWCAALREVVIWRICWTDEEPIGGPGQTVEIDETLFSRRKNHAEKLGGVSQYACQTVRPGFSFGSSNAGFVLERRSSATAGKPTKSSQNDPDYEWDWVNHSKNFVKPDNLEVHTQTIESMWRPLKEARRKRNGNPPLYNDSYLSEGLWRMNVKDAGLDPFVAIVNGH